MARCERRTRTCAHAKPQKRLGGRLGTGTTVTDGAGEDEERLRRQIDDYERKVDRLLEEVGAVKADAELKTALEVCFSSPIAFDLDLRGYCF